MPPMYHPRRAHRSLKMSLQVHHVPAERDWESGKEPHGHEEHGGVFEVGTRRRMPIGRGGGGRRAVRGGLCARRKVAGEGFIVKDRVIDGDREVVGVYLGPKSGR